MFSDDTDNLLVPEREHEATSRATITTNSAHSQARTTSSRTQTRDHSGVFMSLPDPTTALSHGNAAGTRYYPTSTMRWQFPGPQR